MLISIVYLCIFFFLYLDEDLMYFVLLILNSSVGIFNARENFLAVLL